MKTQNRFNLGPSVGQTEERIKEHFDSEYKTLKIAFENPSAKYRPTAFWSLNGLLEEDEIERQVVDMHAHGMGGFIIHARLGLESD